MDTGITPRVLNEIRDIAKKYGVKKVVLFGSRARGDFRERSDIDLAFWGGEASNFILDVDEETYTILQFDFVNMNRPVQEDLRKAIENEGVIIYDEVWKI